MPRRERSFAQEIEERIAAGDAADEEAARVVVADDIATKRMGCRCNFEEGTPVLIKHGEFRLLETGPLKFRLEFRPVHRKPYAWNLWQQIRAGELNGVPVKYSPDNKTITAGKYKIVDIFVWDLDETTAKRMPPVRRGLPAHGPVREPTPAPQSHGAPASAKRQPGDTDKARAELLYHAAKPHVQSSSWTADIAFAAGRKKFPNNQLLLETSARTERKAWLYAKRKLQEEA
jgi:hypothetical protein